MKLAVIGLDCAAPELAFDRFRRDPPNLSRLMEEGQAHLLEAVFASRDAPLPKNGPIEAIEVRYRPMSFSVFGWLVHWIVLSLVLSIASAYMLRGLFRVEI